MRVNFMKGQKLWTPYFIFNLQVCLFQTIICIAVVCQDLHLLFILTWVYLLSTYIPRKSNF